MQQAWEDYYKSKTFFALEPHSGLPALLGIAKQRELNKVLDLGCGAGQDLLAAAEAGFSVTGVEFSPAAAANAEDLLQSKGFEGKIFVDNLFDKVTTLEPSSAELIFAINSLEFSDRETFETSLRELARLLTDNGLVFLVMASKDTPQQDLGRLEQIFLSEDELTVIVEKYFDILDFYRDARDCYCLIITHNKHGKN